MTEATITAPAPGAAPISAPSPAAAPASSTPSLASGSVPTSQVDPGKFPIREDYAAALLKEKLAAIPPPDQRPATDEEVIAVADPSEPLVEPDEPPAEVTVTSPTEATPPAEEDFQLEVEAVVTPEVLSQMVIDNPAFGKLLDADSRLKGQLYKTAREAAELKPYREIFPDLDSARAALDHSSTWIDVRETFLGSTTREGTMASLSKIAELSYERDADGNVAMQNGKPVIGEDLFGLVDNVVSLDLEHRAQDVTSRLRANSYRSEEERNRDQRVKDALDVLREESAATSPAIEAQPEALRRKADELDRRERALNVRQHGEKVEERRSFESGLHQQAHCQRGEAGWSRQSLLEEHSSQSHRRQADSQDSGEPSAAGPDALIAAAAHRRCFTPTQTRGHRPGRAAVSPRSSARGATRGRGTDRQRLRSQTRQGRRPDRQHKKDRA